MSPEAVLPGDALKLAVTVCPNATSVNLRFDCSTPHHIVGHLTLLARLNELSAVCVTSGERTLLDFTDLIPVLEKFGPESLRSLELKVSAVIEFGITFSSFFLWWGEIILKFMLPSKRC